MRTEDVLARRLSNYTELSDSARGALAQLSRNRTRRIAARTDIIREGDTPHSVILILSGWALRYKTMEDGRRQIVGFLLPGDMCDLNNFLLREMDHSIGAVTAVQCVDIPHDQITQIAGEFSAIDRAFWWHMLTVVATQREWTVNLSRSAIERIGNLFCELFLRLRAIGLTTNDMCEFPITQSDIAEATGLTPVHVNRTLQEMRSQGLIVLRDRMLEIPNLTRLQHAVLFTPAYLHLDLAEQKYIAPQHAMPMAKP